MRHLYICITQQHDLRLVALSACICMLGCFTTVTLLARVEREGAGSAVRWIACAAALFGSSVWSLHFVAMLAFAPGLTAGYDLWLTTLSAALSMVGALAAFTLRFALPPGPLRSLVAGAVLAAGVAGMHYAGVSAMRFSGFAAANPDYVSASIVIAFLFGILAMGRFDGGNGVGRQLEVTGWLALSICGLHFTGVAGLAVAPGEAVRDGELVLGSTTLGIIVGAVALLILLATLFATLLEQHMARRVLQELARMRLLSNLAHEVLLIHRDGAVIELNSAGERLLGRPATGVIGKPVLSLFSSDCVPMLLRQPRFRPDEGRPEEAEILGWNGVRTPVEVTCQEIEYFGRPATAVAMRDLSDRKRDEARIRHLARHDALTDLPNRYALEERLGFTLEAAAMDGTGVAVVYLDLDRFKPVNDLYGHAVGDALLVQAAQRLSLEIRPADTLARIGGDEFVVVLANDATPEVVTAVAGRIIAAIRRPFVIEGNRLDIGVSMGIALYPSDGRTSDALLRAADLAMYRVKEGPRGTMRFYEASMNAQIQARRQLESELAHAIERGELALAYQPIVNGATGEVETFEALIRWHHPERGTVSPLEFIPLAEQTDLIGRIGRWVVETACAAAVSWPQPWRVSVNVSPAQFRQPDVAGVFAQALARHGLAPARLVVEITEGVFIEDAPKAVQLLASLRALGLRLALDDFGTGFSSLSYLQLFKFDKFKIDKSFIRKLGESDDALTIVNAIVNLGHNLGLQVTAEGVETIQQLQMLRRLGCDQIQGYLVARPGAVDAYSEFERVRTRAMFSGHPLQVSA